MPEVRLMTYEQAAEYLVVTPRLVRKLVEARCLDSVKIGALVRLEVAALDRYIDDHRRKATISGTPVASINSAARRGSAKRDDRVAG